jgi:hypothetical protein
MFCIESLLHRIAVSIALTSGLAIAFNIISISPSAATAQHETGKHLAFQLTQNQSTPPPRRNPGSSAAGGRRNSSACPQDTVAQPTYPPLTALSPITQPGFTLVARPTFLVYVPPTGVETAEFSLRTPAGQGIYRTTIALTNTPDIISLTLPEQAAPLEVGERYIWSFAIICDPNNRVADQFVTGMVQRTELDPARLSQIEQAPVRTRIALYQEDNIWYESLALLFELKRSQPDDPDIDTAWQEFLQFGGVDTMIDTSSTRPR